MPVVMYKQFSSLGDNSLYSAGGEEKWEAVVAAVEALVNRKLK